MIGDILQDSCLHHKHSSLLQLTPGLLCNFQLMSGDTLQDACHAPQAALSWFYSRRVQNKQIGMSVQHQQDQQELGLTCLQGQRQLVGPHVDPKSWPAPVQMGGPNCNWAFC